MFVFKCMHPASCELGGGKGNEVAGPVGAWAEERAGLLASAELGNLGFVWGKCLKLCNPFAKWAKAEGGENGMCVAHPAGPA